MARSYLSNPVNDLIQDSGSVLWSFVKGEQLEFPITLGFISDVTSGYSFEAVVVEGANVEFDTTPPVTIQPNGIQTNLIVRVPTNRGVWQAVQSYNREELVSYNGIIYRLTTGVGYISSTPPDQDSKWVVAELNKIYLQFPKELGSTWTVKPSVGAPVYGFFELRVTAPVDNVFQRTWKPVRGMVQLLFSPTDIVPDV